MLGRCLALALLPFAVITACSGEDGVDPVVEGGAGEGGETGGGGCAKRGTGTLSVEISGLPSSVDADVTLTTPSGSMALDAAETLDDAPGGTYAITAKRVFDADPIVRTVYEPTITTRTTCLADGATEELSVSYAAIPSSNKLWTSEASGFSSDDLAETADVEPSVQITAPIGKDVAFDRDGNLWAIGATSAEAHLVRLPAASLGSSGEREFDRGINLPIECLPSVNAIAFDPNGNLFVSGCGGIVLKVAAASLGASGDVTPAAIISGLEVTQDLAFDADGNLWTTDAGKIIRYDASRLSASTSDAPDLTLTARDADDTLDLGTTGLAFDAAGNLWGFDFGFNLIFEIAASDLDGTGEESVVPEVSIAVGVDVLLNRGAFDDGGGLWISYGGKRLARLSPALLGVSVPTGDAVDPEVIITSDPVGSDLRLAFFPAAADLPLYHALP